MDLPTAVTEVAARCVDLSCSGSQAATVATVLRCLARKLRKQLRKADATGIPEAPIQGPQSSPWVGVSTSPMQKPPFSSLTRLQAAQGVKSDVPRDHSTSRQAGRPAHSALSSRHTYLRVRRSRATTRREKMGMLRSGDLALSGFGELSSSAVSPGVAMPA